MIKEGHIVLFPFPYTDLSNKKLRPALVLKKLPGIFDDWLICMISSRTHLYVPELDEIIEPGDDDFESSRLKVPSVIRVCRLAVVESTLFEPNFDTPDLYQWFPDILRHVPQHPSWCPHPHRRTLHLQITTIPH